MAHRNAKVLACLRIAVGILFVIFGQYKVFGTKFIFEGGFQYWINRFLEGECYPFTVPILRNFVLPNGAAIAFFVAYGELSIGLALVSGVLVRLAGACGLIYMLALLFSSDYPGPDAVFWQYFGASLSHLPLALYFATFTFGNADQAFSLRTYLYRYLPVRFFGNNDRRKQTAEKIEAVESRKND